MCWFYIGFLHFIYFYLLRYPISSSSLYTFSPNFLPFQIQCLFLKYNKFCIIFHLFLKSHLVSCGGVFVYTCASWCLDFYLFTFICGTWMFHLFIHYPLYIVIIPCLVPWSLRTWYSLKHLFSEGKKTPPPPSPPLPDFLREHELVAAILQYLFSPTILQYLFSPGPG